MVMHNNDMSFCDALSTDLNMAKVESMDPTLIVMSFDSLSLSPFVPLLHIQTRKYVSQEQNGGEEGSTSEEEVKHKEMFHLIVRQKLLQDDDTPFHYECKHVGGERVGMKIGGVEDETKRKELGKIGSITERRNWKGM